MAAPAPSPPPPPAKSPLGRPAPGRFLSPPPAASGVPWPSSGISTWTSVGHACLPDMSWSSQPSSIFDHAAALSVFLCRLFFRCRACPASFFFSLLPKTFFCTCRVCPFLWLLKLRDSSEPPLPASFHLLLFSLLCSLRVNFPPSPPLYGVAPTKSPRCSFFYCFSVSPRLRLPLRRLVVFFQYFGRRLPFSSPPLSSFCFLADRCPEVSTFSPPAGPSPLRFRSGRLGSMTFRCLSPLALSFSAFVSFCAASNSLFSFVFPRPFVSTRVPTGGFG